jgi:hypothetical protein
MAVGTGLYILKTATFGAALLGPVGQYLRRRKSPWGRARNVSVRKGGDIPMNHISVAARAVLSALPWVLVAGALIGLMPNQDSRSGDVAAMIVCFFCIVIACDLIVARMTPGRTTNPLRILKDYFLHCAVIGIAIGIAISLLVTAVFLVLAPLYMFTGQRVPLVLLLLPAVVSVLTMFVMPVAIIEGIGISAIGRGLRVLKLRPRAGVGIGCAICPGHAVHFARTVMAKRVPQSSVTALLVSVDVGVAIILFAAFAGAAGVNLGARKRRVVVCCGWGTCAGATASLCANA